MNRTYAPTWAFALLLFVTLCAGPARALRTNEVSLQKLAERLVVAKLWHELHVDLIQPLADLHQKHRARLEKANGLQIGIITGWPPASLFANDKAAMRSRVHRLYGEDLSVQAETWLVQEIRTALARGDRSVPKDALLERQAYLEKPRVIVGPGPKSEAVGVQFTDRIHYSVVEGLPSHQQILDSHQFRGLQEHSTVVAAQGVGSNRIVYVPGLTPLTPGSKIKKKEALFAIKTNRGKEVLGMPNESGPLVCIGDVGRLRLVSEFKAPTRGPVSLWKIRATKIFLPHLPAPSICRNTRLPASPRTSRE